MIANIDTLTEIGGAKILEYLILTPEQKRTGKTKHIISGKEQVEFKGLAICQYEGEEEVYLFYCDSHWKEINDGMHESIEDAKRQASFEFTNIDLKWIKK